MTTLYQTTLMDHYRHPRNKRPLPNATFSNCHENVHCGDRVTVAGVIDRKMGIMTELTFDGTGCVLSQAIASIITQEMVGLSVDTILQCDEGTYIEGLVGSALGPNRFKCAVMALHALKKGITDYQSGQKKHA
jgi:nitrogen fixation NifU-like protein